MKNLLVCISKKSIEKEDLEFQGKSIVGDWLGNNPATEHEILLAENRLNIKFPDDYREFLLTTNGFIGPNDVEPSFERVHQVDYLKKLIPEMNEAYQIKDLESAILVGGMEEEQQFLLIPPDSENKEWRYWKFANWIPGQEEYKNLRDYFNQVFEFLMNS